MDNYLASSEIIDWQTPEVLKKGKDLAQGLKAQKKSQKLVLNMSVMK